MDELKKLIAETLGIDVATLDTPEGLASAKTQLESRLKNAKEISDEVKEELELSDVTPAVLKGTLKALTAKSKLADSLKTRVSELELAESNRMMDDLVASGKAAGKITDGTEAALRAIGSIALSEYLKNAPVIVPTQPLNIQVAPVTELALSDAERKVARTLGLTETEFKAAKQSNSKQGE